MRSAFATVLVFAASCLISVCALGEEVFPFTEGSPPGLLPFQQLDRETQRKVLAALGRPDRDQPLPPLVIAPALTAETWFDLRGIQVDAARLGGRAGLSRICWDYARFNKVDLQGAQLGSALMRGVTFKEVDLRNANMSSADLRSADFLDCDLRGVDLSQARLGSRARFRRCKLDGARFDNTKYLEGTEFHSSSMCKAVLANATLAGARFVDVDLTGASFRAADLSGADFFGSVIDDVDLTEADLSNTRLGAVKLATPLRLVRTRVFLTHFGDLDFRKVELSYVDWSGSDFMVGEERDADTRVLDTKNPVATRLDYARAEMAYRALSEKYRQSGHTREYLGLHYRTMETRRKLLALEERPRMSLERLWLNLSRFLDGYGTRVSVLLRSFAVLVLGFAAVYFLGWTVFGRDWGRWRHVQSEDGGRDEDVPGGARVLPPAPRQLFTSCTGRRRLWALAKLASTAFWFSLEGAFMFAQRVTRIPDMLSHLRVREERLVPTRFAKALYGLEGILGTILIGLAARMVVLVVGS